MREEDKKYLQELMENSEIATSQTTLKKLAKDMVSAKQFNISLQHKFETNHFNSYNVISEMISLWISYKGREANLNNFEQILRRHELNAEAGE